LTKTQRFSPNRTFVILLLFALWGAIAASAQTDADPASAPMHRAFNRLYNFDFAGSQAIIEGHLQSNPEDSLAYALRGAVCLFTEFNRLKILDIDFFSNDDKITDKKRLKPDAAARFQIFEATAEARKKAAVRLVQHPEDRTALFALCMAAGLELEYTLMVEKKYLRSYALSKETQGYAQKLLALNPPACDAYVTLGSAEYVVANLNFFFRIFARFDGIEGSKQKAIGNLRQAIDYGLYYQPYAKILLTVVYLREKRIEDALLLMKELKRDFPENPLFGREVAILMEKASIKRSRGK
jgi:hypothetical protein